MSKVDHKEFESLYYEYYHLLYGLAYKYLKDADSARDILQQVFIKWYEKSGQDKELTSPKSYLLTAVRNTCLNELKRPVADMQSQVLDENTSPYHSQILEETEAELRIWQAIEALPPKCRRIFTMSRFDEMKNEAIAEKLGISKRTVETQVSIALKSLRAKLLNIILELFF